MNTQDKNRSLREIWNNVWAASGDKSYSSLRLFKTVDKIETLTRLGVDFKNKRVLDIGCGEGTALFFLEKQFDITGVGIDISDRVIAGNKQRAGISSKLEFFIGDHKSLDCPSNEFDIVLSWGVVEHSKEYIQALAEARRVLKKDGILVLIQPNSRSFGVVQEKILRLRNKWRFGNQKNFSHGYLKKILEALGYHDVLIHTKPPYRDMIVTRFFDNIFRMFIKNWGHYLYVIGRKRNFDADYKDSFELFLSHTDEKKVIKKMLQEKIDEMTVRSCLDIGGGNGCLSSIIDATHKITIIEPNKNFVDTLRGNGFRCICAKWENVELEERFDLVLAAYVITHFPKKQLRGLIDKMKRHLNENGKAVILAVDEKEGSWRETHTYFYELIHLKRTSTTVLLKRLMKELGATTTRFTTKVSADNVEQMLQLLTFDFCKYGSQFETNKDKLKDYLRQFEKGDGHIELEMVHWMFILGK